MVNKEQPQQEFLTFEEYKLKVINDDVKKIESKYKPLSWEYIPIIGLIIYEIRMYINIQSIDRGLLRKNITIYKLIFSFLSIIPILFYGVFMVVSSINNINYTSLYTSLWIFILISLLYSCFFIFIIPLVYKKAIEKTKLELKNKDQSIT